MSEIDKTTKQEVVSTIKTTYLYAKNNTTLSKSNNLLKEDARELLDLLDTNNKEDILDVLFECLITCAGKQITLDGDDTLIRQEILYLNNENLSCNDLVCKVIVCVEDDNIIDALGYLEDVVYQINLDVVSYFEYKLKEL